MPVLGIERLWWRTFAKVVLLRAFVRSWGRTVKTYTSPIEEGVYQHLGAKVAPMANKVAYKQARLKQAKERMICFKVK